MDLNICSSDFLVKVQKFSSGTENLVRVQIFSSGYRFSRQSTDFLVRYRNSRQAQKIDGERFLDSGVCQFP